MSGAAFQFSRQSRLIKKLLLHFSSRKLTSKLVQIWLERLNSAQMKPSRDTKTF